MTRLFIRFYVGVLLILLAVWTIQAMVFRLGSFAENIQVAEDSLGGGLRLARQQLEAATDDQQAAVLDSLRAQFAFPVEIVPSDTVPQSVRDRFADGDDVVMHFRNGLFLLTPLAHGAGALRFGSLPSFVGPSQSDMLIGLALVLLLIAVAIALLLRPINRQFRLLERAATAIAGGNFSARVEERRANSSGTLAHAFNNMAERTESLLRTQRELLQAVSHELRTPLSRIHFAIDLIRTAEGDKQRASRLHSLETAALELDDLVGELLRYVRLETSEPPLERDHVELLPLAGELIEEVAIVHPGSTFEIGPRLQRGDVHLHADRVSLKRALGNLLANAARFGESRVVIDIDDSPHELAIVVDDDGPGIPLGDRQRVFEPFVRLEKSGRGAGLGLALVKRIAANHGGTVDAQESPLGGCRIRTVWPRENRATSAA